MKKNDLGFGSRKIFYSLVIFECRYWTMIEATLSLCPRRPEVQTADVIRVDVQCEAAPTQPEAAASLTSSQVLRCTVLYCTVLYCTVPGAALARAPRPRARPPAAASAQRGPARPRPRVEAALPAPAPRHRDARREHDFKSQYLKQVAFKPPLSPVPLAQMTRALCRCPRRPQRGGAEAGDGAGHGEGGQRGGGGQDGHHGGGQLCQQGRER